MDGLQFTTESLKCVNNAFVNNFNSKMFFNVQVELLYNNILQ